MIRKNLTFEKLIEVLLFISFLLIFLDSYQLFSIPLTWVGSSSLLIVTFLIYLKENIKIDKLFLLILIICLIPTIFNFLLNDYFELILSGRLDLHSGQLDKNGISFLDDPIGGGSIKYVPQTSPKVGLLYKPSENHTFRLTAARAFNTPSSQGLYLNLKAAQYSVFEVKARGNKDGYNYIRDEDDR